MGSMISLLLVERMGRRFPGIAEAQADGQDF
jgi:hypothetical protein